MPTYGWGLNEPVILPVADGGDTIATYATKVKNAIDDTFDTLNSFPWSAATQSSAGYMSSDDKKIVDGIADLGTFNKMFFSQSSGNYVAPYTGYYKITIKGGGGGGGGANTSTFALGASGGEGATMSFYIKLTKDATYPYVVGAGGTAGSNGLTLSSANDGTGGGATSFNSIYSASGGGGGLSARSTMRAGSGGHTFVKPTGAVTLDIPGSPGSPALVVPGVSDYPSGPMMGGGGGGGESTTIYARSGAGGCGGGCPANSSLKNPSDGADGFILIEYTG